ncbi:CheR family methyltransferase [Chroococcidiopsis thermalis]|uniref:protein-glutamate O-methyltransferase n=1 Tax=Chroococcidiopsis thermalis (strain PCC 7203) TaxID=251229 RepID=K9TTE3_CHRTP|nr:protein-glutamate O-methyltransferase CheR [Chroococcidiopsis thermalis]AFY85805.1 MCP methyltransferase, CheR-type with PAS/PAC sensor [Chroococcidiopsis thermalis PCC 7203]
MKPPELDRDFEALLDYLKRNQSCDFTGYKRPTLMRRFSCRMQQLHIERYQDYLQYLQSHSQEWIELLDSILINVSSFFRDREAWDYLASDIVPQIIASKQPDEPIRVWSAGCASGQEVYSLLILFAEALGIESCLQRVQLYATDVDKVALQQARQAVYRANEVKGLAPDLLKKYFEPTEQGYAFDRRLRRRVICGCNNLAEDAPMSKIDLLACRNTLMYFNPDIQARILVRFHFALKNNGFLFLGKHETLTAQRPIFMLENIKHRIYIKGLHLELGDRLSITPKFRLKEASDSLVSQLCFWQAAFETSPFAQLSVDLNNRLVAANEQANFLFRLTLSDWSLPFSELLPGKLVSSHVAIGKFYCDRRPVNLKNIKWITSEGTKYLDIFIAPVFSTNNDLLGVNLTFIDVSDRQQIIEKLEYKYSELARVSETCQETKTALDTTRIELEETQKELEALHQEIQFIERDMQFRN